MDRNVEKGNMFSVVWFKYVLSSRIVCLLWYSKGMNPHLERYSLFRGWDYVATVWCLLATQCHWKNFHQKSNCRRRGCVMLLPQATAMIDKPMRYDALLLYIYICIYTPTISIMYIKLRMTLKENNTARPTMQQLQNGYFFPWLYGHGQKNLDTSSSVSWNSSTNASVCGADRGFLSTSCMGCGAWLTTWLGTHSSCLRITCPVSNMFYLRLKAPPCKFGESMAHYSTSRKNAIGSDICLKQ